MKVFKQESTQRTSKAFKQHTFAVLFDHSVFWQGYTTEDGDQE